MSEPLVNTAPRRPAGQVFLRIAGAACATAGVFGWVGLLWKAVSVLDDVTAQSDEGGRLMAWALTSTLLMILGFVLLHIAQAARSAR